MNGIEALLIGAALGAGLAGNVRGAEFEEVRAQGDTFEVSLAAIAESARNKMSEKTISTPPKSARNFQVSCVSPEGSLRLDGDPESGEFEFELIKGDRHVKKTYSPGACRIDDCELRFTVDRESGELRIKGSKRVHEYVEAHRACSHEPHGPTRCANVPSGYEWNEIEAVSIFLSFAGETRFLDIYDRAVDLPGVSADPLGGGAACSVYGL